LYRERARRGVAAEAITQEGQALKYKRHSEIKVYIRDLFGEDAWRPLGDLDRPFTVSELREFSRDPYVCLGNHTHDHAILTNYSEEEILFQIRQAQEFLYDISNRWPTAIGYPSGRYSPGIVRIARQAGLRVGFTVVHQKNYLPLDLNEQSMCLARFYLSPRKDIINQCEMFRSDVLLYPRIRNLLKGADDW
jgi:peptidoglycan/xylan/chitin deacetylase (PgdA/CDA1 family)